MSLDLTAERLDDAATATRLRSRTPFPSVQAVLLGAVPALLLVVTLLTGCATRTDGTTGDARPAAVTDVRAIAGRWSGLLELPGHRQPEFVEMTIAPDGTYNVKGVRTIGVLDVQGRVEAVDGTLRFRGPRATATGQLYEQDARRTLVIDAKGDGGNRATVRLNPVR
jgi:hypothetical protein